jgi:hypothetical protein
LKHIKIKLNGIAKMGKRVMKPISFFVKGALIELIPTNGAKKKNKNKKRNR